MSTLSEDRHVLLQCFFCHFHFCSVMASTAAGCLLLLLGHGKLEFALVERGDESTKVRGEIRALVAGDSADDLWIHGR